MQVLLRDAISPDLVQSLEGTPAFVHGGPFANIAQGTNTSVATRLALKLARLCRHRGWLRHRPRRGKVYSYQMPQRRLKPSTAVIVATVKAIKYHGGFTETGGLGNLAKHIENVPPVPASSGGMPQPFSG